MASAAVIVAWSAGTAIVPAPAEPTAPSTNEPAARTRADAEWNPGIPRDPAQRSWNVIGEPPGCLAYELPIVV
jgi:hypothetical protein